MTNIRDLMTPEDALEMEELYDAVLQEHNECDDNFDIRDLIDPPFDWEVDAPEFRF